MPDTYHVYLAVYTAPLPSMHGCTAWPACHAAGWPRFRPYFPPRQVLSASMTTLA
ncbi:uncharacterized protein B0I36DRAFT_322927 [Microdochium trichocladiopsis]|uniref:Uncharacterized protein n=1 Tax=Microdochium trichocladiopsis TaxID=1682393 RepID=A0A9P9BQJ3_9PEZI|nr:uncharacterized protein B0I36DRAFT_322927 [Microdochium trichocladiopsis]KAH7030977.1 hypothetical protein B0I36DRAFT_322927 [Microdochium trichocladiopsis]